MTQPIRRRVFMLSVAATTATATLGSIAHAQQPRLDEKDTQAVALGYVADAKRVDSKKYPKYAAGQLCSNCALYQGKAADKAAACPLFAGKMVAGPGWCNSWVKKA